MVKHLRAKCRQGTGKIRRLLIVKLRKEYVQRQERLRRGECKRCGACCKLLFNCPYLHEHPDGTYSCAIHQKRPHNCRIFPIDENDIKDRDTKYPGRPCGFYFPPRPEAGGD